MYQRRRRAAIYNDVNNSAVNAGRGLASALVNNAPDPGEAGQIIADSPVFLRGVVLPVCCFYGWIFINCLAVMFFKFVDNFLIDFIGLYLFTMMSMAFLVGIFSAPLKHFTLENSVLKTVNGIYFGSNEPVYKQLQLIITVLLSYLVISFDWIVVFSWQCIFVLSVYMLVGVLLEQNINNVKLNLFIRTIYTLLCLWLFIDAIALTFEMYLEDGRLSYRDIDTLFYSPLQLIDSLQNICDNFRCFSK
jgi:hypothetical protein